MTGVLAAVALGTTLPYAALLIALGTFVASQREFRRRAKVDYVSGLETRILDVERQNASLASRVSECERDRAALRDENFDLMRRLTRLEGRPA